MPTLVTSFGDFRRSFGGYLPIDDFTGPHDRAHCYLPHAIEGLFTNGGKRVYVTRVTAQDALRAERRLFFADPLVANPVPTVLLHPAEESTGSAITPPPLFVMGSLALPAAGDIVRVGDGSRAEYRKINSIAAANYGVVASPLQRSHDVATPVIDATVTPGVSYTLTGDVPIGATQPTFRRSSQRSAASRSCASAAAPARSPNTTPSSLRRPTPRARARPSCWPTAWSTANRAQSP